MLYHKQTKKKQKGLIDTYVIKVSIINNAIELFLIAKSNFKGESSSRDLINKVNIISVKSELYKFKCVGIIMLQVTI